MAEKVLIINGSLRARGNTDTLLASVLDGAREAGIPVIQHILRYKRIACSKGCYFCYAHGCCAIQDDMQEIHRDIQDSDWLILASPLYWWGVTGLMKTFIDRLYLYFHPANREMIAGKRAIVMTPMHVNEREHGAEAFRSEVEPLKMTYGYILGRLGVAFAGMEFFPGLTGRADARNRKEYLDHAAAIGRRLGTSA